MLRNIIEEAEMAVLNYVTEEGTEVTGEQLGLDPRALWKGWVTRGALVIRKEADRSLRYYGGFEYVDADARQEMGDFVIYWRNDDERVEGAISCAEEFLMMEH